MTNKVELAGKLTAKSLGADRTVVKQGVDSIPATEKFYCGRMAGMITGLKETLDEKTGEIQTGLKGSFRGVKRDGTEVRSGVCYPPGGIGTAYVEGFKAAEAKEKGCTVGFVFDLYGQRADNAIGYTYVAEVVVEADASDPLDILLKSAGPVPQLAAPVPEDAGAAPKAAKA